jgi:D-3-phosphoglycerate dehydrogenase / 2-oxoglutarate reductase
MKALITTVPFGDKDRRPLELLDNANIQYLINPKGRKLLENELIELIDDFDIIIAGTEPITEKVIDRANKLKLISRVGIGLDSVDLISSKKKGIKVSYTPDAPSPAVAELTFGLMLNMIRSVHLANLQMHKGNWFRYFGKRLADITIGIIGVGRIGSRVLNHLIKYGVTKILVNDINQELEHSISVQWATKEQIYTESDIITLHLPLTQTTKNMIIEDHLLRMKPDAILINTSRGGIINEDDLYHVLKNGHLKAVAIDVFENEPYNGPLTKIDNCLLTSHMGSMAADCRTKMEIEACEEAVRFSSGDTLQCEVPAEEYKVQQQGL